MGLCREEVEGITAAEEEPPQPLLLVDAAAAGEGGADNVAAVIADEHVVLGVMASRHTGQEGAEEGTDAAAVDSDDKAELSNAEEGSRSAWPLALPLPPVL